MSNIQITHDSSPENARSESFVAINPNDNLQVVAASKKFVDIQTYNATLATQYSGDGGQTWTDSADLALPSGATLMTDPALAWDDSGNVFLVGLVGDNPPTWSSLGIVIYKSSDGGKTWSPPKPIHNDASDDKQWAAGDANPASPFHGNVYAIWDSAVGLSFARTTDHGTNWGGMGGQPAGASIGTGSLEPELFVAEDGTLYVVSLGGTDLPMLVSANGGETFSTLPPAATNISILQEGLSNVNGAPQFPGGTFRVGTDPTIAVYGETVLVAWADIREGVSRIYYARSIDGGATWSTPASGQPLLASGLNPSFQHCFPQLTVDPNGVFGCVLYEFGPKPTKMLIDVILAQSFDDGLSFGHFTVTDQPWDPTVDAPLAHGNPKVTFIGDYIGLAAGEQGFIPVWTDTRTGIQELWTAIVPERGCEFIINRSTLGQNEVDALRKNQGGHQAVVSDAFRVVVDGFDAASLGATGPSSVLNVASPITGMTITCTGNVSESGSYGAGAQRFTFLYDIDFGKKDTAFGFAGPTETVTLTASVATATAEGQIELILQPDPFILHGDPPWLSVDLRVFVMRPNDGKFGVTFSGDPNAFIQQVMHALTQGNGTAAGQSFDDPTVLSPDEEGSALYLSEQDENQVPVFNFALARVRYKGLIGAASVRAFFRLFAAQITTSAYDYPPGHRYRRATTNPDGQPIPLAGVAVGEYVTIPFFALPRVNTKLQAMDQQTDSQTVGGQVLGNVQQISGNSTGAEIDTFFGCWLDINQGTDVLPAIAKAPLDGPFTDAANPPLPIGQAIARNLHQCLIVEIAFDPVTIPPGADTGDSDKLAQRNLAWSPVGSAHALSTFEIRPTDPSLPPGARPDELMIDWGGLPTGSRADIYLPAVSADEVIALASRLYASHPFERVDAHTIGCRASGVTYVPIPAQGGANYTGLLTVQPAGELRPGESFAVAVRQLTDATGREGLEGRGEAAAARRWRKVIGAFQLTIPVGEKRLLLAREELSLGVLRWIGEAIPPGSRWYPTFQRYLDGVAGRVTAFGGDPGKILPAPPGGPPAEHRERDAATGKVCGLRFDRFGDFEGFTLETVHGEREYDSREPDVAELAERAWRERLRITVWSERHRRRRPETIVIREPPARFA